MLTEIIAAETLNKTILANTVREYIIALAVFIAGLIAFKILQWIILNRLRSLSKRTETDIDDTFVNIVRSVRPPFYTFVAFYVALQFLTLHTIVQTVVDIVLLVWVVYLLIQAVQKIIDFALKQKIEYGPDGAEEGVVRFLSGLAKWVLWAIGSLLVLSNLGVNVTSLIAGLGIGGVAIAFALQNILSDLFSSFTIYFDKPFVVGDIIKVGDFVGEVKKIGIKTTRVQELRGEQVVFSNNQLTSDVIQNFDRIEDRRAIFTIGLTYDTPQEKLKKVPQIVKDLVNDKELTEFDRTHFIGFGDSALEFEIAFHVACGSNYGKYLDVQEEVNFAIRRRLEEEGISMAFPTQTINVRQQDSEA